MLDRGPCPVLLGTNNIVWWLDVKKLDTESLSTFCCDRDLLGIYNLVWWLDVKKLDTESLSTFVLLGTNARFLRTLVFLKLFSDMSNHNCVKCITFLIFPKKREPKRSDSVRCSIRVLRWTTLRWLTLYEEIKPCSTSSLSLVIKY